MENYHVHWSLALNWAISFGRRSAKMEFLNFVILLVVGTIVGAIWFVKREYAYWKNAGVPYKKPFLLMGNMKGVGSKKHFIHVIDEFYREFKWKAPFCGVFVSIKPVALITDLDLVRNILIKDFSTFQDRTLYCSADADVFTGNLFFIHGEQWRTLRAKLTPTFTSGKMQLMFPAMLEISHKLVEHITDLLRIDSDIEIKDILARYTMDIIGKCAFGIECNSLADPDSEFRIFGAKTIDKPRNTKMFGDFVGEFPDLGKFFGIKVFSDDVIQFFYDVTVETIEYREQNNVHLNDFLDLLIAMKNETCADAPTLTLREIVAQVFVFFVAGFETSSSTMAFSLYELALNEDLQEKARKSVYEVLKKHGGQITYEAISEMAYLGQVLSETLRKYPVVMSLIRQSNQDYKVPDSDKVLERWMTVVIPVYSIHHDPDIYPNPEIFDPDRFSPDEISKRHPMSFLGFGDGPRNCIGSRFGIMQSKTGLAILLTNFRFRISSKTEIPVKFNPRSFVLSMQGGLNLIVEKI